jgi:hypothetical protein
VSFRVVMMARQIPEGCEGVIRLVSVTISLGNARATIPRNTRKKNTRLVFAGVKAIYKRGLDLESGVKVDGI